MPLKAEQLPPEIWFNIFTYFEGHELIQSFSCLNSFFDSLFHSSHLQLYFRIKQNESSERLPQTIWSHIDLQTIYSLSVSLRKANCLIQFLRWHAPDLTHLYSLSVYLRKSTFYPNIQFLIFAVGQIPSLKRLRIRYMSGLHYAMPGWELLMAYIFSNRCTIENCLLICDISDGNVITETWSNNPLLKYLHLSDISSTNLLSILSFTPNLRYLRVTLSGPYIGANENLLLLHHLTKIDLRIYRSHFTQFEMFKKIAPNLQVLRIDGSININDEKCFHEKSWKELFNNIKYYNVDIKNYVFGETDKTVLRTRIQNFNTQNWFSYNEANGISTASITFKSTTV